MSTLGENIKEMRIQQMLSQQEVAAKVQVTPGFLSQIENNKNLPSLFTLQKLANALGVTVSKLLGDEESIPSPLVRAANRKRMRSTNNPNMELHFMTQFNPDYKMDACIHVLKPLASSKIKSSLHEGQEIWIALEGSMRLDVNGDTWIINKGDCFYVKDCSRSHSFTNTSSKQVSKMLCITCPPFFYRSQHQLESASNTPENRENM